MASSTIWYILPNYKGGHNSKVCYTSTPGLLYSIHYANDRIVPVKSTDGGITWNTLPGNPDEYEETYSIWVDFNKPDHIVIAYYGLIYFSGDGGITFSLIHTANSNDSGCLIGGAFFDGNNAYLGTNDGVLASINDGNLWTIAPLSGLPTNERIFSFAAAKSGNTTRFFCLTGEIGNLYVGQPGSDYWDFMRGVYSCDYGVTNWTARMGGINSGTDFPMIVDMAENDINTVYLAGSNSSSVPIILKTTNAGMLWTNTFLTNNNQNINTGWSGFGGDRGWTYGECPFGFDVAANDANRVIFGDFGFVHKTANGGQTWQQAYVKSSDQHVAVSSFGNGLKTGSLSASGTLELTHDLPLQIYPNPVKDILTVDLDEAGILELFDPAGCLVRSVEVQAGQNKVTLSGLEPGVYWARANGKSGKVVKE